MVDSRSDPSKDKDVYSKAYLGFIRITSVDTAANPDGTGHNYQLTEIDLSDFSAY